jgi:PAS domain S-box-containing protein
VIITLRDITESKVMNETQTRMASIVEFSEDAIIGKDDKGIVTTWNAGAEKIFGYTAAEMIGQPIMRLLPDDRQEEESDILARIKRGEVVSYFETVRKRKDGQFIEVSLTISPIRDARGRIIGASKMARNITQRKQFERQLQQSQKMEAIGQLTGGIAHDFNNLLSVIVGNLGLIGHLVFDNAAVKQRVQAAQRAATRGADLILRLLAFSRNVELSGEPTQLDDSINNVIELAHSLGPDLKMISHLDDSMPLVLVDAGGLENALLNLVVNARDAMPKGGTVTLSTQVSTLGEDYPAVLAGDLKAGRYALIEVSDIGHGMSKETLERVFEPFFTTKPRGKGTGLGLAMVYGFAKQSGGVVCIDSEPGRGTTVSVYLPLAEGGMPRAAAPGQNRSVGKLGGNVLVVDDEPDVLELAVIYLERMGYTVYQAHDGTSALQVLEQQRNIDLLVTDLIMPGGFNGAEIAQKARRWLPHIRVVYCSGFAAEVLEERDMPLVHGPLLNKPYRQEDFESIVSSAMTTEEDAVLTS